MLSTNSTTQGGIGYLLFTDVFSPESKTAYFNRAVDRIRADPRCVALLSPGDPKKIAAHGEETHNKWRRARPIAATVEKDSRGVEHLKMHFHVRFILLLLLLLRSLHCQEVVAMMGLTLKKNRLKDQEVLVSSGCI